MDEGTTSLGAARDNWAELFSDPQTFESGGGHTNEGVDFARYWAMSRLLELEEAGVSDYAIVFEYLQDVMVLDSSGAPKNADLYQVKKREKGSWTRSHLCQRSKRTDTEGRRRKGLTGRSPLGKLYMAIEKATQLVSAQGTFLSNAGYTLKSSSGDALPSYGRTCLKLLDKADRDHIEGKISRELEKEIPLPHLDKLHLEQTRLSPGAMRETTMGLASEYLSRQQADMANVSGRLVERLFRSFSDISGPRGGLNSLAEIIQSKGFTRRQFTDLLAELSRIRPFPEVLDEAIGGMKDEGTPPRVANRIRQEATRIKTELLRHPDSEQLFYWKTALRVARTHSGDSSYKPGVDAIVEAITQESKEGGGYQLQSDSLKAVALLAIQYVDQESTTSNSQSSDKTK
jgi:Cap4, dsDNA endonuclease domain